MIGHPKTWQYCEMDETLVVKYQGGTTYIYKPVGSTQWDAMQKSCDVIREIHKLAISGIVGLEKGTA